MRALLNLEEAAQFLLSILLFSQLDYAWWIFPALLFLPDISIAGYAFSSRTGAIIYNLFHHKLIAVLLIAGGYIFHIPSVACAGIILFGHSAMDRVFGFGLKYPDSFSHTHLGWIGKNKPVDR